MRLFGLYVRLASLSILIVLIFILLLLFKQTVLDAFGCQPNCSCLVVDPEKPSRQSLAMAHKEV